MFKKGFSVLLVSVCLPHLVSAQDNIHNADNMKMNIAHLIQDLVGILRQNPLKHLHKKLLKNIMLLLQLTILEIRTMLLMGKRLLKKLLK